MLVVVKADLYGDGQVGWWQFQGGQTLKEMYEPDSDDCVLVFKVILV